MAILPDTLAMHNKIQFLEGVRTRDCDAVFQPLAHTVSRPQIAKATLIWLLFFVSWFRRHLVCEMITRKLGFLLQKVLIILWVKRIQDQICFNNNQINARKRRSSHIILIAREGFLCTGLLIQDRLINYHSYESDIVSMRCLPIIDPRKLISLFLPLTVDRIRDWKRHWECFYEYTLSLEGERRKSKAVQVDRSAGCLQLDIYPCTYITIWALFKTITRLANEESKKEARERVNSPPSFRISPYFAGNRAPFTGVCVDLKSSQIFSIFTHWTPGFALIYSINLKRW